MVYEFDSIEELCGFYKTVGFDEDKIEVIKEAYDNGITFEQIQIVAKQDLTAVQMQALFDVTQVVKITDEALIEGVKCAIEKSLVPGQIHQYGSLIEEGNAIDNSRNRCDGEYIAGAYVLNGEDNNEEKDMQKRRAAFEKDFRAEVGIFDRKKDKKKGTRSQEIETEITEDIEEPEIDDIDIEESIEEIDYDDIPEI